MRHSASVSLTKQLNWRHVVKLTSSMETLVIPYRDPMCPPNGRRRFQWRKPNQCAVLHFIVFTYNWRHYWIAMTQPGLILTRCIIKRYCMSHVQRMMTSSNETFSALLALCAGNSPVPDEFPSQRPMRRSFDIFFDLCLNKQLSKQSRRWWFETPPCPLWHHCNDSSVHKVTLYDI